jgi:MFS family permease
MPARSGPGLRLLLFAQLIGHGSALLPARCCQCIFHTQPARPVLASRPTVTRHLLLADDGLGGSSGSSKQPLKLDRDATIQLTVLAGSTLIVQMAIGAIVPVLPSFVASLGLSPASIGLVVAVPAAAKLLLNLPIGILVDRVGRKAPLIAGTLLDAAGCFATAAACSLRTMVPARLLVGAGNSAATVAGNAYMLDVVSRYPDRTGLLLGTTQAVGLLGFAAGPSLGGILAERGGPSLPFLVLGIALCALVPLYALLPSSSPSPSPSPSPPPSPTPSPSLPDAVQAAISGVRALLADERQLALVIARAGVIVGWSVWLTVIPLHAASVWGASAAEIGRMFSIMTVLGLASAPLGGILADRWGRLPVTRLGGTISALAVGALPFAGGKSAFYASMAMWDVGEAVLTAASSAYSAQVTSSEQRGVQQGLLSLSQDFTFVLMPLLLGVVAARASNGAALMLSALMMGASTAAFSVLSLIGERKGGGPAASLS